ncbi:SsgA family sporulation/cell division regulator [Streptomyces sp. NPDC086080]|uniref:SsgA family sporulation/cell division regulator n=1 Tax=Streptomyces sp. NPDC086080 TaxID=3365748 RepID=UPI0037D699B2
MSVVEQYARVRIVTDAEPRLEDRGTVPVVLRYDPEDDPLCVRFGLPGAVPREWAVRRDLLEHGLRAPVTSGGIRVWPCGRVQTVVEFHTPRSVSVVEFETRTLTRFLRRTYVSAAEPVPH